MEQSHVEHVERKRKVNVDVPGKGIDQNTKKNRPVASWLPLFMSEEVNVITQPHFSCLFADKTRHSLNERISTHHSAFSTNQRIILKI